MKFLESLTNPHATFIYGMALLLTFAAYIITGSERGKRILGTLLSVFIAAIAIVYVVPPFDIPEKDAKTGQTVIGPDGKEKIKQKGKIPLGIDLKGGTIKTVLGDGTRGPLARPHGVFVDKKGVVYVADSENNRVLRLAKP